MKPKEPFVPEELKYLPQWICFDAREADGRKLPYAPGTDSLARVDQPNDWKSFRAAWHDVAQGKRTHVGFVLTPDDPYVFIDLDDVNDEMQQEIFETFKSYSQYSHSKKGIHIIGRGKFRGPGRHPRSPEIGLFQTARFCMWTGAFIEGRESIEDLDEELLQQLHGYLGGSSSVTSTDFECLDLAPSSPSSIVVEMGRDTYGKKFEDLCRGDWDHYSEYHQDHSSADHALLGMLCDLTESNDQVKEIFYFSGMWSAQRAAKKGAKYVDRSIRKIRMHQAEDRRRAEEVQLVLTPKPEPPAHIVASEDIPVQTYGCTDLIDSLPPGLVKDLAEYSHRSAYLPLQEASLLASITLLSGIAGRAYRADTGAALNIWSILVAPTGSGKDEFSKGMRRIVSAVEKECPSIHKIFAGEFVSGPAFETALADTDKLISYVAEFGAYYTKLNAANAPDHTATLTRTLLAAYTAADRGGRLYRRRRAKNDEGTAPFERPCVIVAGETTASKFYDRMTSTDVSTGLLQRFLLLESSRSSLSFDERITSEATAVPSGLLRRVAALIQVADTLDARSEVMELRYAPAAQRQLKQYRRDTRYQTLTYDGAGGEAAKESMNRAGLKATRLAALLAVAQDFHNPVVETCHAEWAINFVEKCDSRVRQLFVEGGAANPQVKQEAVLLEAISFLTSATAAQRKRYGFPADILGHANLIPVACLKDRVVNHDIFRDDRNGAVTAFERTLAALVADGKVMKMSAERVVEMAGVFVPCVSKITA